ncbi:hypothetical protein [Serratia sp. FS14]|uniref:hypothetical protein n=1 Tax=Serratia sp. (strain FS14) TaxID=1327989 RepID=UPI0008FFA131|nr:hypothetical protein [Serratia sp. FS14]MBH2952477.1 hypothetical protein [Serratia marcescens]
MSEFILFRKDHHRTSVNKSDTESASLLVGQGYEQQPEEIDASDASMALKRFADIKNEEIATEHAFTTGAAFSSVLSAILK